MRCVWVVVGGASLTTDLLTSPCDGRGRAVWLLCEERVSVRRPSIHMGRSNTFSLEPEQLREDNKGLRDEVRAAHIFPRLLRVQRALAIYLPARHPWALAHFERARASVALNRAPFGLIAPTRSLR